MEWGRCHGVLVIIGRIQHIQISHGLGIVNSWKLSLCHVTFSEEGQCYNWGLHFFSCKDLRNTS